MGGRSPARIGRPVLSACCLLVSLAEPSRAASQAATSRTKDAASSVERVELSAGFCLVSRPGRYAKGDRPPLIVCLHETDTGADAILAFWRALESPIGMLVVAPQHHMPGWREADLPCIRAMCDHLREHLSYDRRRILLTGYSAGGAMAFHLLYAEGFPATHVAATANYVPPSVTAERIAKRQGVPVFYAVGMRDINQDRMRASIALLQENVESLTLLRPAIGHRLDGDVGQEAMDWFIKRTTEQTLSRVARAGDALEAGRAGEAMQTVEPIVLQRRWHPPSVVAAAEPIYRRGLERGRARLAEAERLLQAGRSVEALEAYREIEDSFAATAVGARARRHRGRLQTDASVREAERLRWLERQESEGREALVRAQKLVVRQRYDAARQQCQGILKRYPKTKAAARARTLLDQLRKAGK